MWAGTSGITFVTTIVKLFIINIMPFTQGIDQAIEDYGDIDSRIDAAQVEAESTRATALDLQSRAEALKTEAEQVSLEDLLGNGLIIDYSGDNLMIPTLLWVAISAKQC